MTPHEQEAKSNRYLCEPYCVYPHEDGRVSLFTGFHGRKYIGEFSHDELISELTARYGQAQTAHAQRVNETEALRESAGDLLMELGI